MLICNAEVGPGTVADVRIDHQGIAQMAPRLAPRPAEEIIDAQACALLPGLHDHHVHLFSFAASLASVRCDGPAIRDAQTLAAALRGAARTGSAVRAMAYHEALAGEIDREWIDTHVSRDVPVRIQHRSGRLWVFNSAAIAQLSGLAIDPSAHAQNGLRSGRFYDAEAWLRTHIPAVAPDIAAASRLLASHGVVGLSDATPHSGTSELARFTAARKQGDILQDMVMMGSPDLGEPRMLEGIRIGATKIHLMDAHLPDSADLAGRVRRSHRMSRPVAIHCVTLGELSVALDALRAAGVVAGDRIEHGSVIADMFIDELRDMQLTVAVQPHFVHERGDFYLQEVPPEEQPWLYRLRTLIDAGIPLLGSSDAPFGSANPWLAMQAAVDRKTRSGQPLNTDEALSPEQAFDLFLGAPPGRWASRRTLCVGDAAQLCLIDKPWAAARQNLAGTRVRLTLRDGNAIWRDPAR
ncbi:MAG: amidohydrolase family protein [Burkholderiaceae bacterium]|nr:amidohydrolase family protein [Burkholderiaceae bacterium]